MINWINYPCQYDSYSKNKFDSYMKDIIISKLSKDHINILFYNFGDMELIIPNCFVIQPRAYDKMSIACPYMVHPHTNKSVSNFLKTNDTSCKYDLSFVGRHCPYMGRDNFISKIQDNFKHKSLLIAYRDNYFYSGNLKEIKRIKWDNDLKFQQSIVNSRLCLCPLGSSGQSQRFYEVMYFGRIPVFFGDNNIKFPLDWIIDWKNLVPIIYREDLISGKYIEIIEYFLGKSDEELKIIGEKCKEIYYKYFINWKILKNKIIGQFNNQKGFIKI